MLRGRRLPSLLPWAGLTALALAPRLAGALLRRPWHDEFYTVWAAGRSWTGLIDALRLDSGPPLFYAAVKMLTVTGLPALAAARALAVAAGVGAVLVAALAARRALGAAAGWWCGVFLAVHPLAVAWSSEGRSYPLLLLAAAWGWERLERLRADGRGAAGLAAAVALGCWTHGLGLVLAGALAAGALLLPAAARRRALGGVAAGLAAFVPWIPVMLRQPPEAVAWMVQAWHATPPLERLSAPLRLLPPAAAFGAYQDLPTIPLAAQLAAAAACLALAATRRLPRLALVLVLFSAAGLLAAATAGVPVLYPSRAEALYLAPAMALLAAGAVAAPWRRVVAGALAAAGALTVAAALAAWPQAPPSPMERGVGLVLDRLPEGGTLVTGGYWWMPAWYVARSRPDVHLVCFPAGLSRHPGWYDPDAERPAADEEERLAGRLLAAARAGSDVIVLLPDDPVARSGLGRVAMSLTSEARWTRGRVEVVTLAPGGGPPRR